MNQPYIETNPSPRKWKITKLEKIRGERNGGRHNAFIFIRDQHGKRLDASQLPRIDWTWVGRQNDQIAAEPKPKHAPDPYDFDIPLEQGVYATIWVRGAASDKAHTVTAMLPDEDEWNTWGHHSWEIWFEWQEQAAQQEQKPELSEGERLIAEIEMRLLRLSELIKGN